MVEDGRLEFKSASPTQLCLVAVGYHNLAVIQIKMQASDLACKTSQNARKIARLCLSASTRYLTAFQRTHEAALADLKYHMEYRYRDQKESPPTLSPSDPIHIPTYAAILFLRAPKTHCRITIFHRHHVLCLSAQFLRVLRYYACRLSLSTRVLQ